MAWEQLQLELEGETLAGYVGPSDYRDVIPALVKAGYSDRLIAATLNAHGIPTPSGRGQWWPASVQHTRDPGGWAAYMRGYKHR